MASADSSLELPPCVMMMSTASSTRCRNVSSDVSIRMSWVGGSSISMPVILAASDCNCEIVTGLIDSYYGLAKAAAICRHLM